MSDEIVKIIRDNIADTAESLRDAAGSLDRVVAALGELDLGTTLPVPTDPVPGDSGKPDKDKPDKPGKPDKPDKPNKDKDKPADPAPPGKPDPDKPKTDPSPLPPPPVESLVPRPEITAPRSGEIVGGPTVSIFYRVTGDLTKVKTVVVSMDGAKRVAEGREGSVEFAEVRAGSHRAVVELADANETLISGAEASVTFDVLEAPKPGPPPDPEPVKPPVPTVEPPVTTPPVVTTPPPVDPAPKPPATPVAKLRVTSPAPGSTVDGQMVHVAFAIDGDNTKVGHGHLSLDGQPEVTFEPSANIQMFNGVAPGPHVLTGSLADLAHAKILGSEVRVEFTVRAPEPLPPAKPAVRMKFEFGEAGDPKRGAVGVGGEGYTAARGYGWTKTREIGITRGMIYGRDGTFLVDLPDGNYTVAVALGDSSYTHDGIGVWIGDKQVAEGVATQPGPPTRLTFPATVAGGQLAVRVADQGGGDVNFALDAIGIVSADPADSHAAHGSPGIHTHHDEVPDFGARATAVSGRSGSWSDPRTWAGGKVPAAGDVVAIADGTVVAYDVGPAAAAAVALEAVAVRPGGRLRFRTDADTRLKLLTLQVHPGGALETGSPADPMLPGVRAEIAIADRPFDPATDPGQYGHGLICLGEWTACGAARKPTFVRLAAEALAGQSALSFAGPVSGWQPGDLLAIPDTRQLLESEKWARYVPQWETATIKTIAADGKGATLANPLRFDHRGARDADGKLESLPHAANLTRNVVVRSENPGGTRGHVMLMHRARINLDSVAFIEMGRTTNAVPDNTALDVLGDAVHVGANQIGRYGGPHCHWLIGPEDPKPGEPAFKIVGCSTYSLIDPMPYRWCGVVIHGSHDGLVRWHTAFNCAGAMFVGEAGNESGNVVEHNIGIGVIGDTNPRWNDGRDGATFWFKGFLNYIRDNVAASAIGLMQGIVTGSGVNVWRPAAGGDVRVPAYPGADPQVDGQFKVIDTRTAPIAEIAGNECYGAMATALTIWHVGTDGYGFSTPQPSTILGNRAWNVHEEGFFGYPTQDVTFEGFKVLGSRPSDPINGGIGWTHGDYWGANVTIRGADIQGMCRGIAGSTNTPGTLTIEGCYLRNGYANIQIDTLQTPGSGAKKPPRKTVIRDCRFASWPGCDAANIVMRCQLDGQYLDLMQLDEVYVYNYNGAKGDDFRVYYEEQAPDFIVPKSKPDHGMVGAPEDGLTNRQCWEKYGLAIAGAVAPAGAIRRPGIHGLVVPIPKATVTDTAPPKVEVTAPPKVDATPPKVQPSPTVVEVTPPKVEPPAKVDAPPATVGPPKVDPQPAPVVSPPPKAEPPKAEPEPAKVEPSKVEPTPAKTEPAKAEPAKVEPQKVEPLATADVPSTGGGTHGGCASGLDRLSGGG